MALVGMRPCALVGILLWAAAACSAIARAEQLASPVLSKTVSAQELVELQGLDGLSVSPDGTRVVVRVDRQDVATGGTFLEWRILRTSDGRTLATIDAGAPRWTVNGYIAPEAALWSPDSRHVYFRRLVGEEVQVWRVGADGAGLQRLTNDAADVVMFDIDARGTLHYATGPASRDAIKAAEQVEYDEGVLLDATFITGFAPTHNFPVNGRMATYRDVPDAKAMGRATVLGEGPLQIKQLLPDGSSIQSSNADLNARFKAAWEEGAGGNRLIDPERPERARDPVSDRVASLRRRTHADAPQTAYAARGHLLIWSDASGTEHICGHSLCEDADQIAIVGWRGGRFLIFQTETLGVATLAVWDVEADTIRVLRTADGVIGGSQSGSDATCRLAGTEVLCIAAGPDLPPRLIAIDLQSGRSRELLNPNARFTTDRLGVASRVALHDRYGSTTTGFLILPVTSAAPASLPLVITSYSCRGFLQGGSGRDVPEHVLAGQGYAAICIDHSGSMVRRSKTFRFTRQSIETSSVDFYEDAVRVLAERGLIDRERVLLTGFSGSATATSRALVTSDAFTAAAVTTRTSSDIMACYLSSHARFCEEVAKQEGFAPPYDSRDGFLADSPAWNVEKIFTPLLMQLPDVEYVGMMQLYGAMLDYGRAVEMHIFPGAYHYKNQPKQRLAVYERNLDWADFWLLGKPSSRPERVAQDARWSAMMDKQCRLFEGEEAPPRRPWYCGRNASP